MKAKPGELKMGWNRRERDIGVAWGGDGASKADGNLMLGVFALLQCVTGKRLSDELAARGYDLTTLRFSIKQKPAGNAELTQETK
jgi:hypothetical protein